MDCSSCGQALTETDFNTTHFVYLCLNWPCLLSYHPQANRQKTLAEMQSVEEKHNSKPVKPIPKSRSRPGYDAYLESKRINYRHLRDLGVGSIEARNSTSKKRTKKVERRARKKGFNN